jgi:hypothetical protein
MKTTISFVLVAFLIVLGCSKSGDFTVTQDENQLKSAITALPIAELKSARTASPITPWATPGAITIWDNNVGVLNTALWLPPAVGPALPNYSFTQFPLYDFSPYYLNGEKGYNPANYDLMAHFGYISPEAVTGAVVEFTFPHIQYFLPHINNINQQRIYTVNDENNERGDNENNERGDHHKKQTGNHENEQTSNHEDDPTVITCTTDLVKGMNPMFCFLIKVDCGKGKSGFTTFWTDMKVNGVSVKGTIKNKVFACN